MDLNIQKITNHPPSPEWLFLSLFCCTPIIGLGEQWVSGITCQGSKEKLSFEALFNWSNVSTVEKIVVGLDSSHLSESLCRESDDILFTSAA